MEFLVFRKDPFRPAAVFFTNGMRDSMAAICITLTAEGRLMMAYTERFISVLVTKWRNPFG